MEQIERHATELEQVVAQRTEELVRSESRLRAIVDGAAIGITVVDGHGRFLSANPALEAMLGSREPVLVGKQVSDFLSPESVQELLKRFEGLQSGEEAWTRTATQYRRGDGTLGWANVVVTRLPGSAEDHVRFVLMAEDTTAERRTMAALIQSEKLAATGRLVAGLAHEINNPLQAVIGCLGLAQEVLADGGDAETYLGIANQELHRAAKLVADLREVYRPGEERREAVDLNALVRRVMDITRRQLEDGNVEAELGLEEELPPVSAVPDRIQQVLLNIILNAVDAMPEGGRLKIVSSGADDPGGGRPSVRIAFHDTGVGVSADVLEHAFEPFVTTKEKGSGLGLFVCRTIVEQHGGSIRMESAPGQGTTVTIWLPY